MKVILQKTNSAEIRAISHYAAISDGIEIIYAENLGNYARELRDGAMPVGSVEFVTSAMQLLGISQPEFNPYPSGFHYGRMLIKNPAYRLFSMSGYMFIKPVELKRFNGFVYRGMDAEYDDHDAEQLIQFMRFGLCEQIYMSNVVNFVAEWLCYYLNGDLIATCRYDGNEGEHERCGKFLSELSNYIEGRTMAVDIGLLDSGDFCVVECNDAWAIGKYNGISNGDYFNFLSTRWHEIINIKEENDTH